MPKNSYVNKGRDIKEILAKTIYTPESGKYQQMAKDLQKLTTDTLFILAQSARQPIKETTLLRKYLGFMEGFDESSLYDDYKAESDMTDDEYADAIALISRLAGMS